MAFWKSKKSQDKALASREGSVAATSRLARDDKAAALQRATPTGSLTSTGDDVGGSPEQTFMRRNTSIDQSAAPQPSDLPLRNGSVLTTIPNAALYPWSQRRLVINQSHPSPFPRYGAAINPIASKEGDIYVMGGLINSDAVKGDLWMIEAGGSMACYPLATTAEAPCPRVGHASLLVGNAFIVYGGDTKIDESDVLDETLYLLNTSSRQWSRVLPIAPRPTGRYGHSLNILGSKIYIFGGQIEGYFLNDLSAFDLNSLQKPNHRWELLIQGVPDLPAPNIPTARTNHSMVTYADKLYLFGGTNGYQWFSDVWSYDPSVNAWYLLDCIGFIPIAREGHAAALVDDVMYIFGGRTEDGTDLGDLAAFRIPTRRWYTFQNMGPSPSPRSGHRMTTVNKSIVVLGGEPSSASSNVNDLNISYVLDTTKIRYPPNDAQPLPPTQVPIASQRSTPGRRPSIAANQPPAGIFPPVQALGRDPTMNGLADPRKPPVGPVVVGVPHGPSNGYTAAANGTDVFTASAAFGPPPAVSRPQRPPGPSAVAPGPLGPPPQEMVPAKAPLPPPTNAKIRGSSVEREAQSVPPSQPPAVADTKAGYEATKTTEPPLQIGTRTLAQPAPSAKSQTQDSTAEVVAPQRQQKPPKAPEGPVDADPGPKTSGYRSSSPPPYTRSTGNPLAKRSSGRNSQTVALLKELDASRNQNAWYASELELAHKAGYSPNLSLSLTLDHGLIASFDEDDKPLIEALLAIRAELASVQGFVDRQANAAVKQIAEAEKQRDTAIQEALYAKARMTAQSIVGSATSTPQLDRDSDSVSGERTGDMNKKLASALQMHKSLQQQVESITSELEAERRARQLSEETGDKVHKRSVELEAYRQRASTELDRLKAELHLAQRDLRDKTIGHSEAMSLLESLKTEKGQLHARHEEDMAHVKDQTETLTSLRDAVAASTESRRLLERQLEEERSQREKLDGRLAKIKSEHESRTAELVTVSHRLRDSEELAEKHAAEARMHKQALVAGIDKMSTRDTSKSTKADADRIAALQNQLSSTSAVARRHQQEADAAEEKLRRAEERISGLEAYQESASKEVVTVRKQLQSALRDLQTVQSENTDLKGNLAAEQLDSNAIKVQHSTLKDILSERGISPTTTAARSRGLGSPNFGVGADQQRVRELEQQLTLTIEAHAESKKTHEEQIRDSEAGYLDKLEQLENDYQSALEYVKGSETMLQQLQEQLNLIRGENKRLQSEVDGLESKLAAATSTASTSATGWAHERDSLKKEVGNLQEGLRAASASLDSTIKQLGEARRERDGALEGSTAALANHAEAKRELEQVRQENGLLEQRVHDAESRVNSLLGQLETSVDNYRRRSRQVGSIHSEVHAAGSVATNAVGGVSSGPNGVVPTHSRTESSDAGSVYGPAAGGVNARNSAALDSLATELESLRSQWEITNQNYRMSHAFDFETKKDDEGGATASATSAVTTPTAAASAAAAVPFAVHAAGSPSSNSLSESLADWRKKLENEDPGSPDT